eukprot:gnl/MRDRNA2_/MRDRNA2_88284_c0_seq1.p1 gnl/MRDRNA2_/MRDRNA2_88284_c0~~gnl/MRDRNA2_/MRDRNA2_88284_c0_seq1.p1  ORF type:complete len:206 (+),score=41.59 gnl/MRDRNA2_/MRDRNA2_88284_c0_seq1:68-685(+)
MPPPLPPTQCGTSLVQSARPKIQVDLFLDLICPFSSKMYKTLYDGGLLCGGTDVDFVLHQVPQPWHPQGTYVHETALAVKMVQPDSYPAFVRKVFGAFDGGQFKDESTWDKSRAQIYEELLQLVDEAHRETVKGMLAMKEGGCNEMTQPIKWAVKFHRCRGVHVTPTVHVNGLEAGVVSSGWTAEQWKKFLEPMGADNFTASLVG